MRAFPPFRSLARCANWWGRSLPETGVVTDQEAPLLPQFDDLTLFAGFGMVCSLVNVFLQREKPHFEKRAMLWFAVLATGGTGLYAGWLMLDRTPGWLMIFPAWNILNGALLLLLSAT